MFDYKKLQQKLNDNADEKYQSFSASLTPGCGKMLGVRIPVLRKISKEISRSSAVEFLKSAQDNTHEEIILQGMIIGLSDFETQTRLKLIENYVPKITNWASCDIFCGGLKFTVKNKKLVWEFLQKYLNSDKEFEIRFGVVMLLTYYIDDEYIEKVFATLDNIKHDGYYVKMAVAWAVSYCLIKQYEKTRQWFEHCKLDDWTFNKGIQKALESYRIDKETKKILKSLKRK